MKPRDCIVTAVIDSIDHVWSENAQLWVVRPGAHSMIERFTRGEAVNIITAQIVRNRQLDDDERIYPRMECKPL
jgi:hypothetical protein